MTRSCPNCNQINPSDAAFCLNCAASLNPAPHIGAPPNQQWQQPVIGGPIAGQPQPPGAPGGAGQKAMIALGLAVAALFCCGPFTGIPAAIVGWLELDSIKNGRSPESGKWMAMVGLWGGIGSTVIHVGVYIIWVLLTMLSGSY